MRYLTTAANAEVRTPALREAMIEAGCRKLDKQVWIGKERERLWTMSPGMAAKYNKMTGAALAKRYEKMRASKVAQPIAEALAEFDEVTVAVVEEFADLM